MSIFSKPINFVKEVKAELMKVTWSTKRELLGSTVVVIGVTAIMTIFIGIIDLFLSKGLSVLFR
ncbi:MAG: preprotein translocase subunit SecE [Candidatus Omnitrophota bacterium]